MFIAVKEKDTVYVGITNMESFADSSVEDMILDENLLVWKIGGHKGWYMACNRFYAEVDVLRYAKGLFAKEITYQTLVRHTLPKMKELLSERGLIKDKCWYNDMLIFNKDMVYEIDGYFCVSEIDNTVVASVRSDIVRGCMEFNADLPAKERICEGVHSLQKLRGKKHFPVILLDAATGKKEVWMSYEDAKAKIQPNAACESLQNSAKAWTEEKEDLYQKALLLVAEEQTASMSFLQRKLSIGFCIAGEIIERMESEGYVAPFQGGKTRKVLVTKAQLNKKTNR